MLVLILLLTGYIIWQGRRINDLEYQLKPKYGFLGKPLLTFMAVALTVGGLTLSQYARDYSVSDNSKLSIEIKYQSRPSTEVGKYIVSLNAIPSLNNKPWGGKTNNYFDVYWSILHAENDEVAFSDYERGIYEGSQGGIEAELAPGMYKVGVGVIFEGKESNKNTTIQVGP